MVKSISSYKKPVVLVIGGKDVEDVEYESYSNDYQ